MTDCVFCLKNWDNLDIVEKWVGGAVAIINPLNPVTEGHVLIIHRDHDDNAAADSSATARAAVLMKLAAEWVHTHDLQANIITSIGPDATQSVMHTHVHVVPRTKDDGLPLPWSTQCSQCRGKPIVARGMCARCYKAWQRKEDDQ